MKNRFSLWNVALPLLCCVNLANAASMLSVNQQLNSNQYLESDNGKYRFYLQGDGNLVLRDWATGVSLWSSGTNGMGGTRLAMQGDGNLVLYTSSSQAVWASNTPRTEAQRLSLQDNANLVLYTQSGNAIWSTNTAVDSGGTDPSGSKIQHINTTQVWDSNGQDVKINRPSGTQAGDLLILITHRTDDHLPFEMSGWKRAAECYKEDNGYQCLTIANCTSKSGNFCDRFSNKYLGRDLAQVVFYKSAGASEPSSYSFNFNKDSTGHPGWAVLTALRGANTSTPIRDWANRGCDNNADSVFPSVYGKNGDMVLLSQSFDDVVSQSKFNPPDGTSTFGYVSNSDESGFLFGGILTKDGETGDLKTHGEGASNCKDALVSLTVQPK